MTRSTINPAVMAEAEAAFAYRDEIARNEAERKQPQPVITPCLLIVFALAVYIVGLATGVLEV